MSGILPMLTAVTRWDGPPELKHFLLTLCSMADHVTCRGIYGQKSIAKAMGRSNDENGARTVRRLFDRLEQCDSIPVQVRRRARMRSDGKGRTSDEWTLYLVSLTGHGCPVSQDQPDTGDRLDLPPTGHGGPVSAEASGSDQPDTCNGPTGLLEHDQPDTGVRVSESVDQNLLSESDPAPAEPSPVDVAPLVLTSEDPRPSKAKKPEHQQTVDHWLRRLSEVRRIEKPILSKVDTRNVKRLLDEVRRDSTKACELIDNAFTYEWFCANGTIGYLASNPSKYQKPDRPSVSAFKSTHPKSGPMQPGVNPRLEYDEDGSVYVPAAAAGTR